MGARGRRRRSETEIAELMAGYRRSNQTRAEYCAGHGISASTLDYYRRRTEQQERLLPVEFTPSAAMGGVTIVLNNGRRVEFGWRFDGDALARLIGILEQE